MVIKLSFHHAMSRVLLLMCVRGTRRWHRNVSPGPQVSVGTLAHTRQDVKTESGLTQPQVTADVRPVVCNQLGALKRCPGSPPRGLRGNRKARRGLIRTAVRAHGRTHTPTPSFWEGVGGTFRSSGPPVGENMSENIKSKTCPEQRRQETALSP